jgi:heme-degrading monooxygenase HmoA
MIVRSWTGWTEKSRAAEYERYMREVALPGYSTTPGNLGVLMLRRDMGEGQWSEFTMLSLWQDLTAVEAFAGSDVTRAVFYDRDDEYLVEREWHVTHYEVYGSTGPFAGLTPGVPD